MNLEEILNDALNEAICNTNRIKNANSNKVAQFVIDYLALKKLRSDLVIPTIAEITGNTPESIATTTQPKGNFPRWAKLAIVVYERLSER